MNIAKMAATGLSVPKIKNEMNKIGWTVSEKIITHAMSKEEIKQMIEQERGRLFNLVPQAVKNYEKWINRAHDYKDKSDKEIAFKATTKVLESPGLLSGTPSQQINVLMNSGNTIISPVIEGLLKTFMDSLKQTEVIEGEFEQINT